MSAEDKSHTSVLLPASAVTLFTGDSDTKEAFLALESDWRFARVALDAREGDVETAIRTYQGEVSPELVIVQTDEINDAFSDRLEALAGVCAEGTAAIVIGPVNDVNLYRKLVNMGVSDYLVKPVRTPSLADDVAATIIDKLGAADSRLIALMGAKGGVGTTVLTEALAWGLADKMNQKTFLMDAAGGWSTLTVGMNFEPTTTLAEAARAAAEQNEDSLTRMMFTASDKLTILSSGGDVMLDDSAPAASYEALLDMLMITYPVVLVDLSASPAELRRTVLARAHQILLVTLPTLPSVRATRTLLQEIKEIRGGSDDAVDIVVNMSGMAPKHEVSRSQIEEGLERKPAINIGFDPALFISAESEAKKISEEKTGEGITEMLLLLARKVVSRPGSEPVAESGAEKRGGIGQLLTKLKARS